MWTFPEPELRRSVAARLSDVDFHSTKYSYNLKREAHNQQVDLRRFKSTFTNMFKGFNAPLLEPGPVSTTFVKCPHFFIVIYSSF